MHMIKGFAKTLAMAAVLALPCGANAQTTLKVVMHSDLKIVDPIWTTAYITRNHGYMTRTSVLDVMNEDYIRTARAKGQVEIKVLFRHALKNAAVPIVTVIGLGVALLIGGVVVTESVFTIPGLGRLTVDAVLARDYPTIQAVILLFSLVYVLINLAVDLAYTLFDPRIRY